MAGDEPRVIIRPTLEGMGLNYSAQYKKLQTRSWATVSQTETVAEDGKVRPMTTVDLDTWAMLLANIDENRVAESQRQIVIDYQRESAKALRSYWTQGGAINTRATEAQLDEIINRAQGQAHLLQTLRGLVDGKWLEIEARELIARAMGKELELPEHMMPLYVPDFLKDKGLDSDQIDSIQSWFGRRVVAMGEANGLDLPELRPRRLKDGTMRETRAWRREHLPLFQDVWDAHYAEQFDRPMFMIGDAR